MASSSRDRLRRVVGGSEVEHAWVEIDGGGIDLSAEVNEPAPVSYTIRRYADWRTHEVIPARRREDAAPPGGRCRDLDARGRVTAPPTRRIHRRRHLSHSDQQHAVYRYDSSTSLGTSPSTGRISWSTPTVQSGRDLSERHRQHAQGHDGTDLLEP